MHSPSRLALVSGYILALSFLLALVKAGGNDGSLGGEADRQEQQDHPDAFETLEGFPIAVAIFDQDFDGDLDCVIAVRTYFDKQARKADYTWLMKGHNGNEGQNLTWHLKAGATPDEAVDDTHGAVKKVDFLYSDYKDCLVVTLPYKETEQCMLWVTDEVKDDVPQRCTNKFEDLCDMEVLAYDKDTCSAL